MSPPPHVLLPAARAPSWQEAWHNAQPELSGCARMSQLVQLLKDPLSKAIGLVDSTLKGKFDPEFTLLIHLVLYKLSVWDQVNKSAAAGLPQTTLALHGALTIFVPYFHNRIRAHALSNAWPDAPSSDRRRRAWEFLTRLESIHALAAFTNFVVFLWNGRYGLLAFAPAFDLCAAHFQREVSFEFMNRQMVWHAFTEFLLFLLPLIDTRALRRQLTTFTSHLTLSSILPAPLRALAGSPAAEKSEQAAPRGKYWALSEDQCAICADNASTNLNFSDPANALTSLAPCPHYVPQFPIHNPYITSCGHVFCYYCLTDRMMRAADERSGGVVAADRLEAEVEGPEYESGVEDEDEESAFSFDYGSETLSLRT
ncbi:peroxisomal biogenesis factor 2 [Epithele typhae]|uniref:peroxisomal biogenesis factor 2 n=1 Tax=Epithele typhae TaxID=378194 RepID=UPI0020072362|nr:peroxisomal biogenesis factor 2 [Epithele typhae]KAH9943387.1 peroxisomal biogenesis factor 2 [Epithele typhae]